MTTTVKGARTVADDQTLTGNVNFFASLTVTAAGTTQGTATALTSQYNVVTTGTANQGVILPANPTSGTLPIYVVNNTTVLIDVYPPSGSKFNGMTSNAPLIIPRGQQVFEFAPISSTVWAVSVAFTGPAVNAVYNPSFWLGSDDNTTEMAILNPSNQQLIVFSGNGQLQIKRSGLTTKNMLLDVSAVTAVNEIVTAGGGAGLISPTRASRFSGSRCARWCTPRAPPGSDAGRRS